MQLKAAKLKAIGCAILFLIAFRVFQYYPGLSSIRECAVLLGLFSYIYLFVSVIKNWRPDFSTLFILLGVPSIALLSAMSAKEFSGQSIVTTLVTERTLLLVPLGYILGSYFCAKSNHQIFYEALFLAGIFCLSLYVAMVVFLDPADYNGEYLGFAGLVTEGKASWQFNFIPIVMLLSMFLFQGRAVLAGSLVLFVLLFGGRILITGLLLSYFLILVKGSSLRSINSKYIVIVAFIALVAGSVIYFDNESGNLMYQFNELIISFSGEEISDYSLLTRLDSFLSVIPVIQDNILWGVGKLAQNGDQVYFGEFFHAGDLGILGAIYRYGIITTGIMVFYVSLMWYRTFRKLTSPHFPQFYIATFFLLTSVPAGSFWFNPELLGFTIGALSIILRDQKLEKRRKLLL